MEYVLHIGHFKTATKYVQRYLASQRKPLNEDKVLFVPKWGLPQQKAEIERLVQLVKAAGNGTTRDEDVRHVQAFVGGLANPARHSSVLFSNEALLRPMLPIPITLGGIRNRLFALREVFPAGTTKIVITIRRQDSFLESTYTQRVKEFATYSFDEFLDKVDVATLSHLDVANFACEAFGRQNVTIVPYELLKLRPEKFLQPILATVTDPARYAFPTENDHVNAGLSEVGTKILIHAHKILTPEQALPIRRVVQEHYSSTSYEKPVLLTDEKRREIKELHADGNARLFREFLPDLDAGAMGYL